MKVLVIGYADNVLSDIKTLGDEIKSFDRIIAVNRAFLLFPNADYWVTLHPENLPTWTDGKREQGTIHIVSYSKTRDTMNNPIHFRIDEEFPYLFEGEINSGSSGLYAVKYALETLNATEVVLAGIPMDKELNHYQDVAKWKECDSFWNTWLNKAEFLRERNVRSLSGRTAELLNK